MAWIFVLLGLAMATAGGGAIYLGWPLLPLERGWTLTIAGSFFASSGMVCLALAGVMIETRRVRQALDHAFAAGGQQPVDAPPTARPPVAAPIVAPGARNGAPAQANADARSVTIGDTTFIVFDDGAIEARMPEGMRRFASMQELRSYLDERRGNAGA